MNGCRSKVWVRRSTGQTKKRGNHLTRGFKSGDHTFEIRRRIKVTYPDFGEQPIEVLAVAGVALEESPRDDIEAQIWVDGNRESITRARERRRR